MLRSVKKGELVEFSTPDKFILHGFLLRPVRTTKKCIICVHGMGGNFYQNGLIMKIANASIRSGFAFFSINTRGHDRLTKIVRINGHRKEAGTCLERFEGCVYDIAGALGALKKLQFNKFALVGQSTGCQKITYYQYKTKNPSVKALVLLAPCDDYNHQKTDAGKKFNYMVKLCKTLVRNKNGDKLNEKIPGRFSAQRFLSVADLNRVEARLFNYEGPLKEFSTIKTPTFALFGSDEQYAFKPVKDYLAILEKRTSSRIFAKAIIQGGDHSFRKHETEVTSAIMRWLQKIIA